jgi:hypothetical protein
VTAARAADLAGLRVRIALGRLIRDGDPDLAHHLATRPAQPMLCAMALAATAMPGDRVVVVAPGTTEVPGFPATDLADEPWRTARAAAAELGGAPAEADGLRIPAAWMPRGWPALWAAAGRGARTG